MSRRRNMTSDEGLAWALAIGGATAILTTAAASRAACRVPSTAKAITIGSLASVPAFVVGALGFAIVAGAVGK